MINRLLRALRVRREIQRRLDVNLEFDDLDGDAADVRNGARLALVALRTWLDGAQDEPAEDENRNARSEPDLPWVGEATPGDQCWFCWPESPGKEVRLEGVLVHSHDTALGGKLFHVLVGATFHPVLVSD